MHANVPSTNDQRPRARARGDYVRCALCHRRRGVLRNLLVDPDALVCHTCGDPITARRAVDFVQLVADPPNARAPKRVNLRQYMARDGAESSTPSNVVDLKIYHAKNCDAPTTCKCSRVALSMPRTNGRGEYRVNDSLATDDCESIEMRRHDDCWLDEILWWEPDRGHHADDHCPVVYVKRHGADCPSKIVRGYRPELHEILEPTPGTPTAMRVTDALPDMLLEGLTPNAPRENDTVEE